MSAFLGPIHYWLYNKIQIQQELVDEITLLGKDFGLEEELVQRYGESERRPLEEVIDQGNIHGWLQTCVSQVEYKLAYGIKRLLEEKPENLNEVEALFEQKGEEKALIDNNNVSEVYKALSDNLLDGMPCDHAYSVLEENTERVIWKRNNCVHKPYWEKVGGDINQYYMLREAFIRGLLKGTTMEYVKIDDVTSTIRRRG